MMLEVSQSTDIDLYVRMLKLTFFIDDAPNGQPNIRM